MPDLHLDIQPDVEPDAQPLHLPSGPDTNTGRWVVLSLPGHTLQVKNDGALVKQITSFATGRLGYLTPVLQDAPIDPNRRYTMHHSSEFNGAPMPYAMFFYEGCAFHEGNPNVESHGCIHLPLADAEWLFHWVGSNKVDVQIQGPQRPGPHPGLGPNAVPQASSEK